MDIAFVPGFSYIATSLERIRVGAQGPGTALLSLEELELDLQGAGKNVRALLVPLALDQEDQKTQMHWHTLTILAYSPSSSTPGLKLTLTGNWRGLWRPLWDKDRDHGTLRLDSPRCDELVIDLYARPRPSMWCTAIAASSG